MKALESQVREWEVHAQSIPLAKKWEIALGSESSFQSFLIHRKEKELSTPRHSYGNGADAAMMFYIGSKGKQDLYNRE